MVDVTQSAFDGYPQNIINAPVPNASDLLEKNINRGTYAHAVYNLASLGEAARVIDFDEVEEAADIDGGTGRIAKYAKYRDWYAGKHSVKVSDRQRELYVTHGFDFADNFIDTIVDALVRRLKLKSFSFNPKNEEADAAVNEIMRKNVFELATNRLHHVSTKMGDSFAIVDFNAEDNISTISFNRPEVIRPEYSDDECNEMEWASKCWKTDEVSIFNPRGQEMTRLNIYFDNRIEKYCRIVEDRKSWKPFMDLPEDTLWPVPWVDETTKEPLGIPVFHFRNKTLDANFGVSEIHKAIPQQAILNKMLLDLDLILDTQGWPQRWATGVVATTDHNNRVDGNNQPVFDGEPGSVWHTPSETAQFGQFEPATVEGVLASIEMMVHHISGSNSTPIYDMLSGSMQTSGEALKMRDSGLSDKASERALVFGNTWENMMMYCLNLRNIRAVGQTSIDLTNLDIEAVWQDTTPRNDKQIVDVLTELVALGASKRWALEQYGIEDVQNVMDEAALENQAAADMQVRATNRGMIPFTAGG